MIPLERGRFFGLKFHDSVESEFRAHYRRVFRSRMLVLWALVTTAWLVATVFDVVVFPDAPGGFFAFRYAGLAVLAFAVGATAMPSVVDASVHLLTTLASVGIALCTTAMFAFVPFPRSFPLFATLLVACVASTIFVATLHFEYSVVGWFVALSVFVVVVFSVPTVAAAYAAGMAAGAILVTGMSLACTNLIEQYARKNFAQRRILEKQAAAIAEKAEQLEVSERRARDANLAKSAFLSNMSHELRTPLNAVLGFAQLMERDPGLSGDARDHLRIIQRSGDHLLGLINDVLTISTIEAGRVALTEEAFDLREMIGSVSDMIRVRTDAKGLQFLVTITDEVPRTVTGDEGKLRQVLVNLLGNAVKFTENGGVALRVGTSGSTIVLELEDTGFGIAPDELGSLFEAFGQTESGRRSKEGTGLGLAISRNFVRLMGGDIDVRSELDRGTTFVVTVPLVAADGLAPEPKPRRVTSLAPGQPAYRILVVDDNPDNRALLTSLLGTVGLRTREAANGEEAVAAWRDWHPDLIWMDMRMPVMDGYTATRQIRELADGAPCRIIALTASAFQHDRERILADGCDDFVTKPFREGTIFAKLTEHLGAEFVYDEPESAEASLGDGALEAIRLGERLVALPPDLLERLKVSMDHGDVEAALTVAGQVRECDEPLAIELVRLLRAYRFEDVLEALE